MLDKAASGSHQNIQSRKQEDLSFESKDGKNLSAVVYITKIYSNPNHVNPAFLS